MQASFMFSHACYNNTTEKLLTLVHSHKVAECSMQGIFMPGYKIIGANYLKGRIIYAQFFC